MSVYFKATYGMQFVAGLNVLVALVLPWYKERGTALQLMLSVFDDFIFPWSLFNPWVLLWFLPPIAVLGVIRGGLGIFNHDVPWWRSTLFYSVLALFSMVWFFLNFAESGGAAAIGGQVSDVQMGYWLTSSSLLLLVALVIVEYTLPERNPRETYFATLAEDDPERIWGGHYRICPFCGSPNDPESRRCKFCGITLFPEK
jgi:hypothetical protein